MNGGSVQFPGVFEQPSIALDKLDARLEWRVQPQAGAAPAIELKVSAAFIADEWRVRERRADAGHQGIPRVFRKGPGRKHIGQADHPGRSIRDASRDDLAVEAAGEERVIAAGQQLLGKLPRRADCGLVAGITCPGAFPFDQLRCGGHLGPAKTRHRLADRHWDWITPQPFSLEQLGKAERGEVKAYIAVLDGPASRTR